MTACLFFAALSEAALVADFIVVCLDLFLIRGI
jgi:hypothetical protein